MTHEETLTFLVDLINKTDDMPAEEYNQHPDVITACLLIFDEKTIEYGKNFPHNKMCSLTLILDKVIVDKQMDIEMAAQKIDHISNISYKNWAKLHLVEEAVKQSKIELADKILGQLPVGKSGAVQYVGHRNILEYYAKKGDIKAFKERIKRAQTGSFPRMEKGYYQSLLLEGITKKEGIDKGFELIKSKYFQSIHPNEIMYWFAPQLPIRKIDQLIEKYKDQFEETENLKIELYFSHFKLKKNYAIPAKYFKLIFENILSMDPSSKCGDMRCIDSALSELAETTLVREQAMTCKGHMISPKAKRELNFDIAFKDKNQLYVD